MIHSQTFLSSEECRDIKHTLLKQGSFTDNPSSILRIGHPFYFYHHESRSQEEVQRHNSFMVANFSGLLERTKSFFGSILEGEVFYLDQISFPGFHLINLLPGVPFPYNFHQDGEWIYLKEQFTDMEFLGNQTSFTVLLDAPSNLKLGLHFFDPADPLLKKVEMSKNKKETLSLLSGFSNFLEYKLGDIYFHKEVFHSIGGENESSSPALRITYQGSLVKTSKGWLIFW